MFPVSPKGHCRLAGVERYPDNTIDRDQTKKMVFGG